MTKTDLANRFLDRHAFESYEDFRDHYRVKVPEGFNFGFDCVDAWAEAEPKKTAMVWCNDRGEEKAFTFGDMKDLSDRAASFFQELGIGRGDPVMLILKRRHEYWPCAVALHKLGAVAIPATHLLRTKDIAYRNNAADIKAIVCVGEEEIASQVDGSVKDSRSLKHRIMVQEKRPGWLSLEEGMARASSFVPPRGKDASTNSDMMLLYFTSGTTGLPKMVFHDFTYPLGHIHTARYWQKVLTEGAHLTVADTGWAKAAWGKIYGQWLSGGAVFTYDMEKFVPRTLLEVLSRHRVTTFCAPPTIYRYLIKEDLGKADLSALVHCTTAGEPLNPEVFQQWRKATGLQIMEGYGQTETCLAVGIFPWVEPRPGSMGKPSPGYDVVLLDPDGEECEVGEEGEICIRTSEKVPVGVFGGYHRNEELTRKVWHDGFYHTGDTAWKDQDGYFWFVGRVDDLIKSSGYRIGPFEVESALLEHPAVLECAVTAVPDPDRGQVVKATVVLVKGKTGNEGLVKELQEHVKTVTAPYKYPRVVEFVTELPKTISGKIRRVEIRERDRIE